ncbi:MAG: transcriptional regulator [Bacteroidetes bacterium]|nr:transcriptional regulator [Bacteroidota bacterium]
MNLKIIRSKKEYQQYLSWVDEMFNKKVTPKTPEGEKLQVVLLLIKQYEDQHYPIPKPDPIDAIKSKMLDLGLKNKYFVGKAGSKGYVSAILNKRKPLTLELARLFHDELGIPADILLS